MLRLAGKASGRRRPVNSALGHAIPAAVSPAPSSRRQLTLFVSPPWGPSLDTLRRVLDPVQAELIAAHVTLCREDELEGTDAPSLFSLVESWAAGPISLSFGKPTRFRDHGVLLPCEHGSDEFRRLRQWLLQDQTVRDHGAHITLAHPRNPRSAGNTDAALAACPQALELKFASVALIEQRASAPWRFIQEATLGSSTHGVA